MAPPIEVEISNTQDYLCVEQAALEKLVRVVLAALGRPRASISIALVDNATIHAVNRAHLGHDWPTDVISFPLSAPDDPVLSGELVISAEMACASAREIGVEPDLELALYVVHGLLHLCGFDDHDDEGRQRMRRSEIELLAHAGFTNPYSGEGETGQPKAHPCNAAALFQFSALNPGEQSVFFPPLAHGGKGTAIAATSRVAPTRARALNAVGSRLLIQHPEGQGWAG